MDQYKINMYKNNYVLTFLFVIIVVAIIIVITNNYKNNYNKLPMQGIVENVYVLVKYPYESPKVILVDDKNKNYVKQFNSKYFNVFANAYGEYEIFDSECSNKKFIVNHPFENIGTSSTMSEPTEAGLFLNKLNQSIYSDNIYKKINGNVKYDYVITFIHF